MNSSFKQSETDRKVSSMIMVGTIAEVDYKKARVRVKSGDWISAWLPWNSMAGGRVRNWRPPSKDEQVMILSPSGMPEQGLVIPGLYSNQHKQANDDKEYITATDYPDGAREHYDHQDHSFVLNVPSGGEIVLTIGETTLTLKADGTTLKTPKLFVDAENSTFTGNVLVEKTLTYMQGLIGYGDGGGGSTAMINGNIHVTGDVKSQSNITASGDILAGGANSNHHSHP